MKLSDRVLMFRAEKGLTQAQFAEAIGVTAPTLARVESGEVPSKMVIAKLAHAFGVGYAEIEGEAQNGNTET